MQNRLRWLKGATALLYLGPLLAGLGGFGWAVVPVFVAIFLLWLFVLRPQQWPRRLADWAEPQALLGVLTQAVVQVLLVAVSFGIGRGLGGVTGLVAPFPLMLPVAVSFLSIPLARMIWDPWQAEALDSSLDEALARLDGLAEEPEDMGLQERIAIATELVVALHRLPDDADPQVLQDHLRAMGTQVAPDALRVALMDPIYDGSAREVLRRAAIVHATDVMVAEHLQGATYPLAVFHELATAEEYRLFAARCAAMIRQSPTLWPDCPDPENVEAMAQSTPEAAEVLADLATLLRRAAAPA